VKTANGRFWFQRVGVFGPVAMGPYQNDPGPEARTAGILARVASVSPDLFTAADENQDQAVTVDELCAVIFENINMLQPANRNNNPIQVAGKTVAVHIAGCGPLTPFYQIAMSSPTRSVRLTCTTLVQAIGCSR